jgi:hypothetical protein
MTYYCYYCVSYVHYFAEQVTLTVALKICNCAVRGFNFGRISGILTEDFFLDFLSLSRQ